MKKQVFVFLIILSVFLGGISYAQSFQDNEYYRKSLEYARLSQSSMDAGEYTVSAEHAVKAQEYAELSRRYIERMRLAYQARSAYVAAKTRMDRAERMNLAKANQELYDEASRVFAAATAEYNAEQYAESIPDSRRVIELLKDFESRLGGASSGLAAFYEVKLNPVRRDCFWRIAALDYIYGDPWQWRRIYNANKDILVDPNNPNIIEPGQILKIPSVRGEKRSGTR
jgi:nucleoid-associated protein YgaU